jgi:putative oxidoreductase
MERHMKIGRLLLRLTIGGLFIGHGTQKLFGWFGGPGLEQTGEAFEGLGIRPGRRNAIAAGVSEAGGGALLAAGLLTPLAATALTGTMLTAIQRVHAKNGPWVTQGGYEYNLVLIVAVLTVAELGPGGLSLDAALGQERSGPAWALAALAAAVAGAAGVDAAAKRYEPTPADASADTPAETPAEAPVETASAAPAGDFAADSPGEHSSPAPAQ